MGALCLLASACSMSDDPECPDGPGGGGSAAYMRLSLDIPSAAPYVRAAAPSGGEDGDGRENGQTYENYINDALVFLLPQGTNVNSSADTKVLDVLHFRSFTQSEGKWKSEAVETEVEPGKTYPVIVVANPGDRTWANAANLTLGGVRDHIYTEAWTESQTDGYSYFLMSSEKDGSVTFTEGSSESQPSVAEIDVERVAARVDYKAQGSYECTDPAYTGGTVTIEGAALVNDLTAGSYLLKRVADTAGGTPEYLGDENPLSGVQTNYVIDPWTTDKTAANAASGTPFALPGGTQVAASGLYGLYYNDRENKDPSEWKDIVKAGTPVADPTTSEEWMRVGYTLENTTDAAEAGKAYSTGVVFRAKFTPAGLTSEYFYKQPYKEGQTFFAVGNKLYVSLEDIMLLTFGDKFDYFKAAIDTDLFGGYNSVRVYLSRIYLDDLLGYKAWILKELESRPYDDLITESDRTDLSWNTYVREEFGYDSSASYNIDINLNGIETRTALIAKGVRTYENANCYYTYWIRHSGDDTAQKDEDGFWNNVMGHAIVRNNIYKINVTSVYSLGGDVPDPYINPIVHVWANKWTLLPGENLDM